MGQAMIVAGIGCRTGVDEVEVVAAVEAALSRQHLPVSRLDALATAPCKADEPGLSAAAVTMRLPLLVAAADASDPRLLSASSASLLATGLPSVAECAALGAAGSSARLLGPRLVLGRVTCALAADEAAA